MQLTDWLVVILLVAILVVLLDGVRRRLLDRRNRVVVKLEKNLPPADDVDDEILLTSAELPNGGARTLPRNRPVPSLRNLKSTQKVAAAVSPAAAQASVDARNLQGVPVLMDAVEVEEERIEHTNVFAGSDIATAFASEDFGQQPDFTLDTDPRVASPDSAHSAAVDEDYEEDAPMLTPHPAAPQVLRDTRYMGRDDDEDDEFEDEELEEEEEEFEEEDEFEDDELPLPGEVEDDDFDDDFDDDDDEEDEDDYDDEDDELDDEDDDYDDDEEEEEEDDLDELEGLPEDEWGSEEEQDLLADDYESEPVLLQDAYSKAASHFSRPGPQAQARIEPGFGDSSFNEDEFDEDFSAALSDDADEAVVAREPFAEEKPVLRRQDQVDLFREEPRGREEQRVREAPRARPAPRQGERPQAKEPAPEPVYSGPQEVIIINVMARPGQYFAGADLLPVLLQQGLRLGEMSIFHRHADQSGSGPILFSMANMVKPGTFDLATMDEFVTPGVSLFMQMPNKLGNMQCFEQLLKTASVLAQTLDGELKDENRSVFTRQTVEHCRQRVRDFELLLLSKKQ